ncbi:MAG: cation:proton antiporter [Candidatus Woesearchaeota archaeon]|nr:cation:proton antiporter [Candidatus Woesearchaeota archaeon]
MENIFLDIGVIIIVAAVGAFLARLIKQPLIPAYVIGGILLGPVLGLIVNNESIATLSEIGIAFLLFIVGLEMDFRKLKNVALVCTAGGLIQMAALFGLGFLIAFLFGFKSFDPLYLGLIIAFSSTMVVIKLLADKGEIETLHGRIIIGILLMEDVVAIFALSLIQNLGNFGLYDITISTLKGIAVFVISWIASKYILPYLFKFAAKTQEILFLGALATSFAFSILFSYLGFSIVIGAFTAGIALANTNYSIEIAGKIKSLKDFFSTIFFVSLGLQILPGTIMPMLPLLIALILAIIIIKPLLTITICSIFGYKKRPSFIAAISLAQTSEFSLIIVMQGVLLGHISNAFFSMAVVLATATMLFTSYFIKFDNFLYEKIGHLLNFYSVFVRYEEEPDNMTEHNDVALLGYDRIGYSILKKLKLMGYRPIIVDYNPDIIKRLKSQKFSCMYGDVGDSETLAKLGFSHMNMIISTVPDKFDNLLIIKNARESNEKAIMFVTANNVDDALELYDAGADYVILPHFLGGEHVSLLIEKFSADLRSILEIKMRHIEELKERKKLGHEHPEHAK